MTTSGVSTFDDPSFDVCIAYCDPLYARPNQDSSSIDNDQTATDQQQLLQGILQQTTSTTADQPTVLANEQI